MRKTTVLFNRHARRLRPGAFADRVNAALGVSLGGATVVRSETVAQARLAVGSLRSGRLVVAGGDGAVNLALNALSADAPELALIPAGTANDLARALAVPLDPERAAAAAHQPTRAIDVLTVNGRRFCTTGGLGLPAKVAKMANRLKKAGRLAGLLGHHLYPALAGGQIIGRPGLRRKVTVGWTCAQTGAHQTLSTEVYGLLVTNIGAVAGDLRLCASELDDGVFEVVLLPARGRTRLLDLLWDLSRGLPARAGALPVLRARAAHIECDTPTTFFGDGEVLAEGTTFEIGIQMRALHIVGGVP